MQKLTNVESQRMLAVLNELLERLKQMAFIPLESKYELIGALRNNRASYAADSLHEHWRWEELLIQSLVAQDSRQHDIADQVKASVHTICRAFRDDPVAMETLYQYNSIANRGNNGVGMQLLLTLLSDLTDLTQAKLEKTVEDAKSKADQMNVVESRMKQAESESTCIRDKLIELRKAREEDSNQLSSQIHKFRGELHAINHSASQEMASIENELNEALSKAHDNHTETMNGLIDRVALLEAEVDRMTREHREEEELLRKKKSKAVSEVAYVIEKYDEEMFAIEEEIKKLRESYEHDKEACNRLDEHFLKVDEEQARIDEEERIVEEIRERERQKQQYLHDMATRIQKVYRGMIARREYSKLRAKTKKGKKRGKQKK